MRFNLRSSTFLGALLGALLLAGTAVFASNPTGQVIFGPGQPVTLTGATPAGVTTAGGVVIDTVSTLTSATSTVLDVRNNGTSQFKIGPTGHLTTTNPTPAVVTHVGGSAISCSNGAGTAATCTDTRGLINVTTAASTATIVLTFGTAFNVAPVCVINGANANAATDFISTVIKPSYTTSTTALTITPASAWAASAKVIAYHCIE